MRHTQMREGMVLWWETHNEAYTNERRDGALVGDDGRGFTET